MKQILFFALFIPCMVHASLEGVYQGKFEKNGVQCEFNADIRAVSASSLTIEKWETLCDNGTSTTLNGPVIFAKNNASSVVVTIDQEPEIYHSKTFTLTENSFELNYDFDAFLEGMILKYDILFNLKLEKNVLNYEIKYKQNEQLIFNDMGSGIKLR